LKCALDEVQASGKAITKRTNLDGEVTTERLSCTESCMVRQATSSQPNATKYVTGEADEKSDQIQMDYNRYCFYNCRPYDFTIGNMCVRLSKEQRKALKGMSDPAVHPKVTDPKVQRAWDEATGVSPKPTAAPPRVTTTLPCEQRESCAYGMMKKAVIEAKESFDAAKRAAERSAAIAASVDKADAKKAAKK